MIYKPGDVVYAEFVTQNYSTGAVVNADSLPTGIVNRNGTDTGVTVTVTNLDTGRYKAVFTIPTTYIPGDHLILSVTSVVSAITMKCVPWFGKVGVGQGYTATGTSTAATSGTITLQTALGADNICRRATIAIVSGTGAGQARNITSYVDSTKVVTTDRAWTSNPDTTSVYTIFYTDHSLTDDTGGGILTSTERTTLSSVLWSTLNSTLTTANTIGKLIVDSFNSIGTNVTNINSKVNANLDVPVTSRLAASGYSSGDSVTISNIWGRVSSFLDVQLSLLKAKTDQLLTVPSGTVSGSPTTTSFTATGTLSSVNDAYKHGYVMFTSGVLSGLVPMQVLSYVGSSQTFNFTAPGLLSTPSPGDTFVIFGSTN